MSHPHPTPTPTPTPTVDLLPDHGGGGRGRHRGWVLAVAASAQLSAVLDVTIVNVALPSAQADLGLSDPARGAVVTVYALAFGSLLLLGGRTCDVWGRKRSFLLGTAGFGLASALGGLAGSPGLLLVARGLQGGFAALLAPSALALVSATFPSGRERVRAFAVYGVVGGAGAALGLVLGGLLTQDVGWRWCLLVNLPVAALALLVGLRVLVEEPRPAGSAGAGASRYDLRGAVLASTGLAALLLGLSQASRGWTTATVLPLAAGAVLLTAFVHVERRTAHPLLPLHVLSDRVRAGVYLTSAVVGTVLLGAVLFLTFYLQLVLGLSPVGAGLASLPLTLAIIATAPVGARLLVAVGPRALVVAGATVAAAGLLWLAQIPVTGTW